MRFNCYIALSDLLLLVALLHHLFANKLLLLPH